MQLTSDFEVKCTDPNGPKSVRARNAKSFGFLDAGTQGLGIQPKPKVESGALKCHSFGLQDRNVKNLEICFTSWRCVR